MSAFYALILAVFAVSWSSIFIRFCGDTPALVISFYRLFWSTLIFALFQLKTDRSALKYRNLSGRSKLLLLSAGIVLAFHFITWISSVQLTLVSHATILGSVHPIFAILFSAIFLKEKGGWLTLLAAFITLSGILLIGGQDIHVSGSKLSGDILAVLAAFFVSIYILIARHQREKINFVPYLIAVYGSAAAVLFFGIISMGYPVFGYPLKVHGVMFLLALIPTCIGHSLINWAARRVEIFKVNFFILGEPIIASLLAYSIWREKPYGWFYPGAILIIGGILLVLAEKPKSMKS